MIRFLADTSAWTRSATRRAIAVRWATMLDHGELAICTPVALEMLYTARNPADYANRADQLSGLPSLPLDERASQLAEHAQAMLAGRSQYRGPRPIDLLIAAIAEAHGAILLHYDRHFDLIRRVTGQPMEWLARRGSLD